MSSPKVQLLLVASAASLVLAGAADAQTTISRDKVDALEAQISSMQQELRALKGKVNNAEKSAEKAYAAATPVGKAPAPAPTAVVRMSPNFRPAICSPDGLNCISITSRLHFDVGGYDYRPNTVNTAPQHLDDGVNARRARLGVLGTFNGDWNYGLVFDFGGSSDGFGGSSGVTCTGGVTCKVGLLPGGITSAIQNAYVSYVGIKGLAIEGGYMDSLFTLDEATSSNDIMFLERASSQVIASNIAAGDFRSQVGARWWNDWFWVGAYATGPTSGAIHSGSSNPPDGATEQFGGFTRAAVQLVREKDYTLHVGGGVAALFKPALDRITNAKTLTLSDRPEIRIDPSFTILSTSSIANVRRAQVYTVEAAASAGPLYFQGEYFWYNVDRLAVTGLPALQFQGGYAQASWVITGETRSYNAGNGAYNGVTPKESFSWAHGGWGAWEIAGRYSVMDLNDRLGFADGIAGGKQQVYTLGLNWYVNRNMRFMLDYFHGKIDKDKGPTGANALVDIGAKFDAVALRTQVAF
jgi:phosphate-selective porin OprO and OprP